MKHERPAAGLWFAPCCILDMQQIEPAEVDALIEDFDDERMLVGFGYYDTREELVAAIEAVDGPGGGF